MTTSQRDDGKQQDKGESGAVAGAVVSTVIIVWVTVGIIALLWLWRRYTHIGGWHIHVKQYLLCICVIVHMHGITVDIVTAMEECHREVVFNNHQHVFYV